jgi:hypothetical protein
LMKPRVPKMRMRILMMLVVLNAMKNMDVGELRPR